MRHQDAPGPASSLATTLRTRRPNTSRGGTDSSAERRTVARVGVEKLLGRLLGVKGLRVRGARFESRGVVVEVLPPRRKCIGCGGNLELGLRCGCRG